MLYQAYISLVIGWGPHEGEEDGDGHEGVEETHGDQQRHHLGEGCHQLSDCEDSYLDEQADEAQGGIEEDDCCKKRGEGAMEDMGTGSD